MKKTTGRNEREVRRKKWRLRLLANEIKPVYYKIGSQKRFVLCLCAQECEMGELHHFEIHFRVTECKGIRLNFTYESHGSKFSTLLSVSSSKFSSSLLIDCNVGNRITYPWRFSSAANSLLHTWRPCVCVAVAVSMCYFIAK